MDWITYKPDKKQIGKACLVTTLCADDRRIVQNGWYGWGEVMQGSIAYMDYPKFNPKKKGSWKSEYMGDDLPSESGHYIVALQKVYGIITHSGFAWFNAKKNSFGCDVIAWHPIPRPYIGAVR
mgnify:CR=1 FL=1